MGIHRVYPPKFNCMQYREYDFQTIPLRRWTHFGQMSFTSRGFVIKVGGGELYLHWNYCYYTAHNVIMYIHVYIIILYGRRYLGRHEGTVKTLTTRRARRGGTGVTEADPKDCYRQRRIHRCARVCVEEQRATSSGGSGGSGGGSYSAGPRSTGFSSVARLH